MKTQTDIPAITDHHERERREREFARRTRIEAQQRRNARAAEEHMAKCRGMLVTTDDERQDRSMRLQDFLPLVENTKTDDQPRLVFECAVACCELTEEEWPKLSAAINRKRQQILGVA